MKKKELAARITALEEEMSRQRFQHSLQVFIPSVYQPVLYQPNTCLCRAAYGSCALGYCACYCHGQMYWGNTGAIGALETNGTIGAFSEENPH